jgi:hypothetical protein
LWWATLPDEERQKRVVGRFGHTSFGAPICFWIMYLAKLTHPPESKKRCQCAQPPESAKWTSVRQLQDSAKQGKREKPQDSAKHQRERPQINVRSCCCGLHLHAKHFQLHMSLPKLCFLLAPPLLKRCFLSLLSTKDRSRAQSVP